ncbi:MAG: hypothetical protein AB1429_11150 [Pseudomonadota bacterium]|mgnify:CR=1 FL=1|jgi:hypothetical protein
MPLFVVIAKRDPTAVREKVKEGFKDSFYELRSDTWIVDAPATSNEIADRVGIRGEPNVGTGLVVSINGYSGRAENDLWEWLKVHWPKAPT